VHAVGGSSRSAVEVFYEAVASRAGDLRWPVIFALCVAIVVEIPFRLAASQTVNGLYFGGMLWGVNDPPQYFSAMRQGAESASWLIYDRLSQEPHAPALLYPFYVGLGKLAAAAGMGMTDTFLAASTLGRLSLLLAIWYFTGLVSNDLRVRRAGLFFIALVSGLTATLGLVERLSGVPLPIGGRDLEDPELSTSLVLFTAPHLMVGLALLLTAARLYADCWASPRPWRYAILAIVVALLGLVNPFTLVPLCALVAVHSVSMLIWRRRLDRAGVSAAALVMVVAGPLALINAVTFSFDPFWGATYGRQNQTLTPPIGDMLQALGLLTPLALLAIPRLTRSMTPGRMLILVWIPLALVLMQAPIGVQRRLGIGIHPSLALLAAMGALPILDAIRRWKRPLARVGRPLVMAGLAQSLLGSTAYNAVVVLTIALAPLMGWQAQNRTAVVHPAYEPAAVVTAGEWLAEHAPRDAVVLATDTTASDVAARAPVRAYVGHWVATLNYREKDAAARWFYAATFDAERLRFLHDNQIDYVVYGPIEVMIGPPAESDPPGLTRVFQTNGLTIFQVIDA